MAVGKGSMERASKAVAKPVEKSVEEVKAVEEVKETKAVEEVKAEVKTAPKKATVKKTTAKKVSTKKAAVVKDKAVIAATSKQVMDKIVYQSSSQILEREAKPNESFYVGDDMPIYFL